MCTFYWCVSSCWRCFCHLSFPISPVSGPSGWSPPGGFCGAAHPTVKQSNTIQVWSQLLFLWERQLGEKVQLIHRQTAVELCEPPHRSNHERRQKYKTAAHECCRTWFRSTFLLVSCSLTAFSFRVSSSCWNTYSWCSQLCFFRIPARFISIEPQRVLLHS